jgi:hypothetical protein
MGRIPEIPGPILWGILSTPIILALIVERFWGQRRRRALWVILIAAASINVSVASTAYFRQLNVPLIVWSTMTVLGVIIVFAVAEKYLASEASGRKSSR